MSLVLLEGFDDGLHTSRWQWNGLVGPVTSTQNRFGRSSRVSKFTDRYMRRHLDTDEHATITIGFWFYADALPAAINTDETRHWVKFESDFGLTTHCTAAMDPNGSIRFTNGNGTAIGSNSDVIFLLGSRHYIEVQAVLHDTTGSMTLWADGVQKLNVTGVDTKNGGTKTVFDAVRISGLVSDLEEIDDIYITNGGGAAPAYDGNLGDVIVETLFPDGNGNSSDFTGSDGNSTDNYLLVDENPSDDGDTSYVETTTSTNRDMYTFDNLSISTGSVIGVMANGVARYLGTGDTAQLSTRISATNYDSADINLPTSYDASVYKIWEESPATAAEWTITELNGAEFGIEKV